MNLITRKFLGLTALLSAGVLFGSMPSAYAQILSPMTAPVYYAALDYPGYAYVLSHAIAQLPVGYTTIMAGPETYYYADGIFYQKSVIDNAYAVVPPPVGADVDHLPAGYQMMMARDRIYYVYQGVFYIRLLDGYRIIRPLVS